MWWLLRGGYYYFSFFKGIIVTYLSIIHMIFVAKSCGIGCRKLAIGCLIFRLNLSHSHQSLIFKMVVM